MQIEKNQKITLVDNSPKKESVYFKKNTIIYEAETNAFIQTELSS